MSVTRRRFDLVDAYVLGVVLLAIGALAVSRTASTTAVDWWGVAVLGLVGLLLQVSSTHLRTGGARGSIAFLPDLSAIILFGSFWAAIVTLIGTFFGQLASRRPVQRVVFNAGQKVVSVVLAGLVYGVIGGAVPFSLFGQFSGGLSPEFEAVFRDVVAFAGAGIAYFLANSMAVSLAVALESRRRFFDVWRTNTLWVFGYDLAASGLAIVLAWFYTIFDQLEGLTRLGFLAVFLPIILVKHVYSKLNTLQGLYDELDVAHAKLEQNMREQLAVMVKSIEARDPYTSGHSRRVAVLSRTIAREIGLPEELISEVENAALMHDVGKIHAEFAPLLSKEGKLTPDEWEVMKTHAVKSEELVAMFSRFHGIVQAAVRSHHERWDGLGYPDGLANSNIPMGSRIIMVADTIDAMTTERPYRKPLGFDVVISELLKHRGTQFDPALVDCAVNSVSIRRLATTQGTVLTDDDLPRASSRPVSLRSHESFFTGRRLNPGGE